MNNKKGGDMDKTAVDSGRTNPKPVVFDVVQRTDSSPMKLTETYYDFHNRSARQTMELFRCVIEDAVKNYPKSEVDELVRRLKSGDDNHFWSATFELFLHEALRREGFSLIPHPELPNGSNKKPDFLVEDSDGRKFYLEATVVSGSSASDKSKEARKGEALDILNRSPHKNFLIAIDERGSPNSTPSGKKLTQFVHEWLDSLDPDQAIQKISTRSTRSLPSTAWYHNGWKLIIRAIPIEPEGRGKNAYLIDRYSVNADLSSTANSIKNRIKAKGKRYGEINLPLVLAISVNDNSELNQFTETQALFGKLVIPHDLLNPNADTEGIRISNGAWIEKGIPQYTRVCAAWFFDRFDVLYMARRNNTVYLNPWAKIPAPESLKRFPHAFVEQEDIVQVDGISFKDIFQLPEGWPKVP